MITDAELEQAIEEVVDAGMELDLPAFLNMLAVKLGAELLRQPTARVKAALRRIIERRGRRYSNG